MKNLLVIQRRMTHYRVPFFELLRQQCAQAGINLQLAYGEGTVAENVKQDAGHLSWALPLPTRYLLAERLCWQPFGHLLADVDMLVVAQENKLLYNLLPQFFARSCHFAYWGHGANLQGDAHSLRERFKRRLTRHADWWLAYTEASVPLIEHCGFPRQRITVLNNAIDMTALAAERAALTPAELARLRTRLGLQGTQVAAYVGSLYAEKRIDFLLAAALRVRQRLPGFELIIIGAGPLQEQVAAFCREHAWAHYLGAQQGRQKVAALALARLIMNPGGVGLSLLDAFACGLPLLTTDCGLHGPEIAYLESQFNGLMTADDLEIYASEVVALLVVEARLAALREACLQSARRYSLDSMAERFVAGVEQCLASPIIRFGA